MRRRFILSLFARDKNGGMWYYCATKWRTRMSAKTTPGGSTLGALAREGAVHLVWRLLQWAIFLIPIIICAWRFGYPPHGQIRELLFCISCWAFSLAALVSFQNNRNFNLMNLLIWSFAVAVIVAILCRLLLDWDYPLLVVAGACTFVLWAFGELTPALLRLLGMPPNIHPI